MKCNSNCNYEVISLCDIKKFNKEIGILRNMPWTQFTVPETLNIPKEKPPIKSIQKVYINIEITSSKIIQTPKTSVSNSEGMLLTGKKLLIDGNICEKIIYNSCVPNKSLNSLEFKIPFSTYIVINHDADIYNDKFTIKTCIEDVFATPLSEKTIFQSTTLLLFANRISTDPIPPDPSVPTAVFNGIIINNSDGIEVATVTLDLINKVILVESTGEIPNQTLGSQEYFSLILRTSDNFIEVLSTLESDEDATNFFNDLNDSNFDFTKSIELRYLDNTKITITDLPDKTQSFNPVAIEGTSGIQSFSITDAGLIPKA